MTEPYTLYGSYASYYTAKTRACLRKKGIPFVERLPSDPMFRNKVRPASGSHRIPQLLTPGGEVVQDSVQIQDHLEALFPAVPAIPSTPRQRIYVHLLELLGSEGLVRLAWLHRWVFADNRDFVIRDFGRSFKPQGSDEELLHYGQLIADRMMSYGLPESTAALREQLDEQYKALLALFETHFTDHPYLLGGHPSAADYAVMGALHAHLGRDPAGLQVMQANAPRVFRWVEHMNTPEIQSPEFYHRPIEYPANDEVPATALAVLAFLGEHYAEPFVLSCLAFAQAMQTRQPQAGEVLWPDQDQPALPAEHINLHGQAHEHSANVHGVWLAQRAQKYFHTLVDDARASVVEMLGDSLLVELVMMPVEFELARQNNRFAIARPA